MKPLVAPVMLLALVVAPRAWAHGGAPVPPPTTWRSWEWDPLVVIGLAVWAGLYGHGLKRLRAATSAPRKSQREALLFFAGWLLLVVALISPLHPWGRELFSAHMTQHELLMVAAAPLLVLGRPGRIALWGLSRRAGRELRLWNRALGGEWLGPRLLHPLVAWTLHTVALWVWHLPALFEATRDDEFVHALQHASFLGTALLFWRAIFYGHQRQLGYGIAVLYLFATLLQSGALGALITFASHPWYSGYAATTPRWGLTPVEDQQLGGLIMWVPAGLAYVIAALALFRRWLVASGAPPRPSPPRSMAADGAGTCPP